MSAELMLTSDGNGCDWQNYQCRDTNRWGFFEESPSRLFTLTITPSFVFKHLAVLSVISLKAGLLT
jgi:hypothetical protein